MPCISPKDRGFLLADGVFETIYIKNGCPIFLYEHVYRLMRSLDLVGIELDMAHESLSQTILRLITVNGLDKSQGSARVTVTRGKSDRGINLPSHTMPTVLISTSEISKIPSSPVSVIVSAIRRNEYSPLSRIKSLSYLDNILARKEAGEAGADDAVFLNTSGNIASATVGNIFIVDARGNIATPPIEDGALPGITRMKLIELLSSKGFPVLEQSITLDDFNNASEIFITNSIVGLRKAYILERNFNLDNYHVFHKTVLLYKSLFS